MKITTATYDDWKQVFVDEELYFEGHSVPDHVWEQLLESLGATLGGNVDFSNWGPLFAYGDVPRTESEVFLKMAHIKGKEELGFHLNEWGEWTMDDE